MVRWLAILVVLVVSGIGVVLSPMQLRVLQRLLSRVWMLWVGGDDTVMLMLVALVMLLVRVPPAELRVLAPLVTPMVRAL